MDLKSLSGKTKTIYTCIIFSLCLFWSHIYRNKTLFTGVLDKLFEYWWNYLFLYIFWIKLGFPQLYTFNIYNCNWSFFRFWSSVNALTSKHWWQLRRTTKISKDRRKLERKWVTFRQWWRIHSQFNADATTSAARRGSTVHFQCPLLVFFTLMRNLQEVKARHRNLARSYLSISDYQHCLHF